MLSNTVSAGDDILATQYNNLRSDVLAAHHQDALGTKIVNADVDASAAIVYSKLNLSLSIVNADVGASAAIAWTKLNKTGSNLTDMATRNHVDLQSLQGGTTAEYYHLTSAQNTYVVALVAAGVTVSEIDQVCDGVSGNVTAANLSTLTGGGDADALHKHSNLSGVGNATTEKTYWNFTFPYLISTNVPSGDFWTNANSSFSSLLNSIRYGVSSDTVHSFITSNGIFADPGEDSYIDFDTTKKVIVEFGLHFSGATGEECGFGLAQSEAAFQDYDDQTVDAACFTLNTDGKLYAHTSNAGSGHTEDEITGITITDSTTCRIEFDPGVDVKFYVNGVLESTIDTNLPDSNVPIKFGWGGTGNTNDCYPRNITEPNFAVEK